MSVEIQILNNAKCPSEPISPTRTLRKLRRRRGPRKLLKAPPPSRVKHVNQSLQHR